MNKFLGVIRAPFLILTPVCVLLGVVTAYVSHQPVMWGNLAFALIAAVAAHISVNALNEYFDFTSGLDLNTIKTPFSGGSGVLVNYPEYAASTFLISIGTLIICLASGLYLVFAAGPGLLPFGLLGTVIVATYTPWINRHALLCLLAPGIAFGPIMVIGTHYALTGSFSSMAVWVSLVPLFLVSNLLLLNQFPDVDADRSAGRRHLPILVGRQTSGRVFGALLMLTYIVILLAVILGTLPLSALLGTVTAPVAIMLFIWVSRAGNAVEQIVPALGLNVLLVLITLSLLGAGIYLS